MSYLIIQENWQTFKDQFADLFSGENFFTKKRRYFDKLFNIKNIIKKLSQGISKEAVDPIKFDTKSWNKFCNKYKKTVHKGGSTTTTRKGKDTDTSYTYNQDDEEEYSSYPDDFHSWSATNDITQVTTSYPIPCGGNKFYVAYFTFDTDGISTMTVITKDDDNTFGYNGYRIQDVTEIINSIPVSSYRRF